MCQHALIVSRPARTSPTQASSASLARWGAAAACLAALSYGAWGYLDSPDASEFVTGGVVPVLGVTTPVLFLGGLAGLYSWTGSEGSPLRSAALLVGLTGTVLGVFDKLDWWESDRWIPLYAALTAVGLGILVGLYFWPGGGGATLRRAALAVGLAGTALGLFDGLDWWEPDWWSLLFVALTAAGLEMVFWEASRFLGALLFASGVLGWVSLLTDPAFSYVLVPTQQVHVAFAALFCLSCVVWGVALFRVTSQFA